MNKQVFHVVVMETVLYLSVPGVASSQRDNFPGPFQGDWSGGTLLKDKMHAPVGVDVYKQRCKAVDLTVSQVGDKIGVEYGASIDWGRRFEGGEFEANVVNNIAVVKLNSSWGGSVLIRLSLDKNKLYWKILKSDGENYFPSNIILRRMRLHR